MNFTVDDVNAGVRRRHPLVVTALLCCLSACSAPPVSLTAHPNPALPNPPMLDTPAPVFLQSIIGLIDVGAFTEAERQINKQLATLSPGSPQHTELDFQRERMRRIRLDFSLTEADARLRLQAAMPNLKHGEFELWTSQGLLESQIIDGERRYFRHAVKNLFYISDEALARRQPRQPRFEDDAPLYTLHDYHRSVQTLARANQPGWLKPQRIRIKQSLTVKADAVPAGETVRAWLPYPRDIPPQQSGIVLLSSQPDGATLAPVDVLQRTAYLEQTAIAGAATSFAVEYELTVSGYYQDIDADAVQAAVITPELAPFIAERWPHVQFTDALKAYSQRVVGEEKNPYRIAQRLFAAVDVIPWAIAREYSTLANISDYAMHAGHADCGQKTLLLISLLRYNGIPARWQSGWEFSDGEFETMHDWGAFYLAPYGWLPMDVTHGRLVSDDPALKWFYLGGIDGWRVSFNDDYSRDFSPAKQHHRSENVDLQRGEVEWRGGNLYFDQWDYHFDWQLLPANP